MPPKKSSTGRPRRATRTTVRKSVAKPQLDKSPQITPGNSSATIPSVEEETPVPATATTPSPSTVSDAKESQFPSPSVVPTSDGSVPTKDRLSDVQSSEKIENAGEPSNAVDLLTNTFQLLQSEQNSKIISETDKISASPQSEQNPKTEKDILGEDVQDTVIETAKDTAPDTANNKISVSPQAEHNIEKKDDSNDSTAEGGLDTMIETAKVAAADTANDKISVSPPAEQKPESENNSAAGGDQDTMIETAKDTAPDTSDDKISVSHEAERKPENENDSAAEGGHDTVIVTAEDASLDTANDKISVAQPEQIPENENDSVAEGGQDTVIDSYNNTLLDSANDTAPDTADVEAIHSTGGKAKKVVKKKVKVVKKIIKKVPKRVVKGTLGSKVDELEKPTVCGDVMNVDTTPTVSLKVARPDKSVDAESIEAVEVVEKKDDREAPDGKECAVMDDDKNDCSDNQNDKEVKMEPLADSSSAIAVRDGETGNQKVEMEGKEEVKDGGDGAMGEDETGEPILFSGEMEAMERRKRRKTEIFLGGLDKDAEEEDIRKVFEKVGEVLEVRLKRNDKTKKNKGYAFLRYASATDAKRALEKFAKVEICGKQCGAAPVEGNDTIYLGNVDKKWKEKDIDKLLLEIGIEKIDKVTVIANPSNTERNRGFAFVEFETNRDAQIAFRRLQENNIVGKKHKLNVAWAQPLNEVDEQEMLKVKTVYAEFIPSSWDEGKVRDAFKKYGEIDNVVLSRNLRTSKRKDFAFVNYKTREAAISCIESFSREFSNDDEAKVNVKVSLAKPMQKGKQPKQVAKPIKKVPKENPKPIQSHIRSVDSRNKERLNIPHYGAHRAEHSSTSTKLAQRSREQAAWKRSLVGPSRGEFGVPHYEIHRAESSATTAELVQLMREQTAWKQPQMGPIRAHAERGYPEPLPSRKRPLLAMEADPLHSDLHRYPYPRLEPPSVPVAARSYNSLSADSRATPYSLSQHQRSVGYESRLLYGSRDYPANVIRDRTYRSNNMYRGY